MEDEAQRMAAAGAQHADAVTHRRGRPAPAGGHRPLTSGEDQRLSLSDGGGGAAGLRARALLDGEELTACVIHAGPVEADDHLERKDELAVEVAMQRVPVARPVPEQQRCGAGLAGQVTLSQPVIELVRPWRWLPEPASPFPGDHHQMWPEGGAQLCDQLRQRPIEVSVLALPEAVASHIDGRAEPAVVAIEAGQ